MNKIVMILMFLITFFLNPENVFCQIIAINNDKECINEKLKNTFAKEVCKDIKEPVCGCDGVNYKNECEANKAGVSRVSLGPCGNRNNVTTKKDNCIGPRKNTICTSLFDPVCGCDGVTYTNSCLAGAAGVKSFTNGECGKPSKDLVSDDCFGTKSAKICTSIFDPVCGCDGNTYSNECVAAAAGIKSFTKGECNKRGNEIDECKGNFTVACPPEVAAKNDPVCGCDGVTYRNDCLASAAGVRRFTKGPCNGKVVDDCKSQVRVACQPNLPDNPVCGCDGKTYRNECEARNFVNTFTKGKCKGDKNNGDVVVVADPFPGARGCGAVYNHISKDYDAREKPACKVNIDMYACDNGVTVVADPVKDPRRVIVANNVIIDDQDRCLENIFCVPTKVQRPVADSSAAEFTPLNDAVFKINGDGNFEARTKKDRFLCGGIFSQPNDKGEVWGNCVYNKKNYCVRLTWEKGVLDLRERFTRK